MISIPSTVEQAVSRLTGLDESITTAKALLTASEWERAAIVAALIRPTRKGRPRKDGKVDESIHFQSFRAFAGLGIVGLRNHAEVSRYYRVWMEEVGVEPDLGGEVELPTTPFPPVPPREPRAPRVTTQETMSSAPPPTPVATEATMPRPSRSLAAQRVPKIHGFKMNPHQKEALAEVAEDLFKSGYGLSEIGRAAGVDGNTVKRLLDSRGVDASKRQARKEDPARIDWPGRPADNADRDNLRIVEVDEQDDSHVLFLRAIRARCEAMDDLNRLAYVFDRQIDAGNLDWMGEVEADLVWVHDRIGRLVRIIQDYQYREFCKSSPTVRTGWDEIQRNK